MTDKRTSHADRTPVRVMTRPDLQAAIARADLSPLEEKVIRMRYGLGVADDHPVGGPAVALDAVSAAEVAEMEAQVLQFLLDTGDATERDLLIAELRAAKG